MRHSWRRVVGVLAGAGCSGKPSPGYQGYVEGEFVHVSSSEAGRLVRLSVTRGQRVQAGTPLFALESINEAAAQRQARQQLSAAEAQLKDLRTGKRPQELDVIRAQLAQAVAEEKKSAADLVRDEAQYKAGGISNARLDETRARAEADAARTRELSSQLDVAGLSARDEQIKAQAANAAAARAALEQAEWKLESEGGRRFRRGAGIRSHVPGRRMGAGGQLRSCASCRRKTSRCVSSCRKRSSAH